MITSEFTDKEGFKLQFDESCTESDKRFFREQYPKVDLVANQRLHCTTCDVHIGTAPISEKIVRTHQVLGVTQCNKCFAFYNSGEFGKGEDGSEYYCRWCGQGGEVFCCSSCPFVFCNKCIRSNLTQAYVKEIEETDDWSCFVCDKNILQKHRGQHWALRNFMNKQLEKIQKINITSEDDLNNLLNEDVSNCCPRRKRKSIVKPVPAPVKRPSMNNGFMSVQPPAKRPNIQPVAKRVQVPVMSTYRPSQPQAKAGPPGKKNDEIVCTPDIMGLFNDNSDASMKPSTSLVPPPLVMRNNQRAVRPQAPAPIYHNVNGFQIDLNHAARQEIFRLPNGKLIQVRKQTGPPSQITPRPGIPVASAPRGPQFTIRQANSTASRPSFQPRSVPQARARFNMQPQTRFTFSDGRVVAQPVSSAAAAAPAAPTPSASTVFTQQNGSISVARAPQPNTPFGTAKTEFEDKIISGMEICQHTINKMITLTNSTSFKTSGNFKDLKDLYIHLQYLFTYTSGKFNTLQEGLKTGMESLAKQDMNLKDKADDDELEIVEEKQDIIEVMSDDDEPPTPKEAEKSPAVPVKKPLLKHIQYTKDTAETSTTETGQEATEEVAKVSELTREKSETIEDTSDLAEMLEKDKKLRNRVVVKVEKLENTKNPIIKQFMAQLQERMEKQSSDGSREGTPDNLFEPMVMLEEENVEDEQETAEVKECTVVPVDDKEELETQVEIERKTEEETCKKLETSDDDVVEVPSDDDDVVEMTPAVEKASSEEESMEVDSDKKQESENEESMAENTKEEENTEVSEAPEDITIVELNDSLQESTENAEESTEIGGESSKIPEISTGISEKFTETLKVSAETEKQSTETPEKSLENQEKLVENQENSSENQEKLAESLEESEIPEKSTNNEENSSEIPEKATEDQLETVEKPQESLEIQEAITEDHQQSETSAEPSSAELPQEAPAIDDKSKFLDCTPNESIDTLDNTIEVPTIPPLGEKNTEDLPTIDEVTKINEIDDEKALLEDLFNELENKSSAMEVD